MGFAYDPSTGLPIEGLAIVPIDTDGDGAISDEENFYATRDEFTAAVANGRYPFPPARVLWLGELVEHGPAATFFQSHTHELTHAYLTGELGRSVIALEMLQRGES